VQLGLFVRLHDYLHHSHLIVIDSDLDGLNGVGSRGSE
jgi:hypothetical protein